MSQANHRVLIVGGGGREHALAVAVAASKRVAHLFVAPGNAGTARMRRVTNVALDAHDSHALRDFARDNGVTLTVVGPEAPLAAGIVDVFSAAGLRCFGPTRAAARLEASKVFAKAFFARHAIPSAQYSVCTTYAQAEDTIRAHGAPIVLKADGLAAGKGVVLAATVGEALDAARAMLAAGDPSDDSPGIVVESYLEGEEASFIALVDGQNVLPLASSQDHKAAFDGDTGPNTGGMGAYSPAPVMTPAVSERVLADIVRPAVAGMAVDGNAFRGFLYAGVMIDPSGAARVLEFNVRLGDPEAQVILPRLASDIVELIDAALAARLDRIRARWHAQAALGVVMAAEGYPGEYTKGQPITGLDAAAAQGVTVYHAGTRLAEDASVRTDGGRVLCVCALGDSVADAHARAYAGVDKIHWPNAVYRHDIGYRAINRSG